MRVHHLNCGTLEPLGGPLMRAPGTPGRLVAHCLLIETGAGLILVDTGIGLGDIADAKASLGWPFVRGVRPRLDRAEAAATQVRTLGYDPADVRHVVLTHLDLDHAGGLRDFPQARVHVSAVEHRTALAPPTLNERGRYRRPQWAHGPDWVLHETDGSGDDWFGFAATRPLAPDWPELRMIPLAGHTRGHTGVAVPADGPGAEGRWLLHAGDAYFHRGALTGQAPAPVGLRLFEAYMQRDRRARLANAARLRELAGDARVELFCAHDPAEYERLAARQV